MPALATRSKRRTPKYRFHSGTGQAFVEINTKRVYLGRYDAAESRQKYHRLIAEWEACGRQLPAEPESITTVEVIDRFFEHAKVHYRGPDGQPTTELQNFRQALRPPKKLYGPTLAHEFGRRAIKAVREQMIRLDWARRYINGQISRIKSMFRWATEEELIQPSVYHGLIAVRGLQAGRTQARETEPVRPVPEHMVDAVKPHVSRQVWAIIQLQLLSGCRPGEAVRRAWMLSRCPSGTSAQSSQGTCLQSQPREA